VPTYEVEVRGSTDLGELGSLKLEAAKDLAPHSFESATPQEAAARAVAELTPRTAPLLVYVRDEAGGVTIFWPSGEPLTYSRRDASGIGEGLLLRAGRSRRVRRSWRAPRPNGDLRRWLGFRFWLGL